MLVLVYKIPSISGLTATSAYLKKKVFPVKFSQSVSERRMHRLPENMFVLSLRQDLFIN